VFRRGFFFIGLILYSKVITANCHTAVTAVKGLNSTLFYFTSELEGSKGLYPETDCWCFSDGSSTLGLIDTNFGDEDPTPSSMKPLW